MGKYYEMYRTLKNSKRRRITVNHFKIIQVLGRGAYGKVYEGSIGNIPVAIKKMALDDCDLQDITNEIENQKNIRHTNVMEIYDMLVDDDNVYIIMELATGNTLHKYLQKNGPLCEEEAAQIFYQVCLAMRSCHRKNIVHRDLKPENLLMTRDNTIKLIDFGHSIYVPLGETTPYATCGTLEYLAPELVERQAHDRQVDVWCLGILLFELLTGDTPFYSNKKEQLRRRIRKLDYTIPESFGFSPELCDLIERILQYPEHRINLDNIMRHPWLRKVRSQYAKRTYDARPTSTPDKTSIQRVILDNTRSTDNSKTASKGNSKTVSKAVIAKKVGTTNSKLRKAGSKQNIKKTINSKGNNKTIRGTNRSKGARKMATKTTTKRIVAKKTTSKR